MYIQVLRFYVLVSKTRPRLQLKVYIIIDMYLVKFSCFNLSGNLCVWGGVWGYDKGLLLAL